MKIAIFHELPKQSGSHKSLAKITEKFSEKNTIDLFYTSSSDFERNNKNYRKKYFFKFAQVEWNGSDWKTRLYRDTIELFKLFLLHRKIAKKIQEGSYDAVFIHGSYLTESPFLLLFKNKLKIYYAHAPNYSLVYEKVMGIPKKDRVRYAYELINRFIRKCIDKANVRNADVILANSFYTKNKISSFYNKKSTVSYLGVDTGTYKPLKIKKKYDFLFVGSYHPVDGYNLLYQAIGKIKKKPNYKILAIEDEWISNDIEMVRLYNSAKMVLCLSHQEPFGLVVVEAMACGVPVIAIDEAGYRETVMHNKTGFLIRRDPIVLADTITSFLRSKKKLAIFSHNARKEAVKKWSWEKTARDMEKIIKRKVANYEA